MKRQQALEIAKQIIGNMLLVRKTKDHRQYSAELNYVADCIMKVAEGHLDLIDFQRN